MITELDSNPNDFGVSNIKNVHVFFGTNSKPGTNRHFVLIYLFILINFKLKSFVYAKL